MPLGLAGDGEDIVQLEDLGAIRVDQENRVSYI